MKIKLKEITIKEVSNKYVNDNEEGVVGYGGKLNIRPKYQREFVYKDHQRDAVNDKMKREAYERQKGICPDCKGENKKKKWEIEEMEADHIKPWHNGGKTIATNCKMLCKQDNRIKSGK